MTVGGDEVLNERMLLTKVESGLAMRGADAVRFLVVHCSATRCDCPYTPEQMLRDHKARGFRTVGYHFYVRRDGKEVYYQAVRTRQAEALHAMTEQLVDIACPMPDKEGDSYE